MNEYGISATIVLILLKIILDLVKDRNQKRRYNDMPCSSDCYYPSDRDRDQKIHSNVVKLCGKQGVDADV